MIEADIDSDFPDFGEMIVVGNNSIDPSG